MYWKNISFQSDFEKHLPETAGLYAILRAERVQGLPISWEVTYVGKSVNLRRRFREHATPWRERSRSLRRSQIYSQGGWEFWCKEVKVADLDKGEQELIRRLRPASNVILYEMEQ